MKVILNSMVPLDRRERIERVVQECAAAATIEWLPGPSQKVVVGIVVDAEGSDEPIFGSIFESPMTGTRAVSAVKEFLESRIWISMSASGH